MSKEKTIEILTFGKDKCLFTPVLEIIASRVKLPPLMICKGKISKRKEKYLNTLECVNNKFMHIKCQENSWSDINVFKFRINDNFKIVERVLKGKNVC
jgi:hypothetical protein